MKQQKQYLKPSTKRESQLTPPLHPKNNSMISALGRRCTPERQASAM